MVFQKFESSDCGGLSTLFPDELLQLVRHLEIVQVIFGQEMQVVFQIGLPLSSLRELKWCTLPKLKQIEESFSSFCCSEFV